MSSIFLKIVLLFKKKIFFPIILFSFISIIISSLEFNPSIEIDFTLINSLKVLIREWFAIVVTKNKRDKYKGHKYYQDTIDFCENYDQNSFDPNYKSMTLKQFTPMVKGIFSRKPFYFL